jgi:hypothetical protein
VLELAGVEVDPIYAAAGRDVKPPLRVFYDAGAAAINPSLAEYVVMRG